MLLRIPVDHCHKFFDLLIGAGDLHSLTAQHVRRPYQNRIAQPVCHFFRLLRGKHRTACRTRYMRFLQNLIEQLPIFCRVYILRRGTKDRHSHFHQTLRQLNRRLAAKLHDRSIRLFQTHNMFHIFRCQRFKIQLVRNIKICADRFRIIVYDNRLIACFCKCPGRMHAAVIKLHALADTNRPRAKHKYFFTVIRRDRLVLTAKYRVIIWRYRFKLGGTCVYHLIGSRYSIRIPQIPNLTLCPSRQLCNHTIRKFQTLGFF